MPVSPLASELATAVKLHQAGRLDQAGKLYAAIRARDPRQFDAWHLGGMVALQLGRPVEAVTLLGQAHQLNPRDVVCLMRLGLAEMQMGQPSVAVARLEKVVGMKPDFVEAWDNLGMARKVAGDLAGGIAAHERAVALKPGHAPAWYNLGQARTMAGDATGALAAHERALQADAQHPKAHYGRAVALQALHRIPEAVAAYDAQLQRNPQHLEARSARLMALHYLDGWTPEALAEEHRTFGRLAAAAAGAGAVSSAPTGSGGVERMRIGFLSPDLREHAVASFFEPLLRHLDREQCEVVLYHDHFVVDAVSERLRAQATAWRHIVAQPPAAVEKLIRGDRLDVLVDLTGHTGLNRLALFARRLAPLQVTYLGYPDTTGLAQMDLRLTDALADPAGVTDGWHTERLVRFARCAWTWQPPADAPAVPPPPSLKRGYVTFGSCNNAAKLSDSTLRRWAAVLAAVPGSRLLLKARGLELPAIAEPLRRRCAAAGLPLERLEFRGQVPTVSGHLAAYGDIDVALDPSPYHGTTTTCEALWMGRPVVTLAGDRHAARVGVSLLHAVGHPEWIAADDAAYVARAAELAGDPARRTEIGAGLRERIVQGPLGDHRGAAQAFLAALREAAALQRVAVEPALASA